MSDCVKVTVAAHVAHVVLNRPDKNNAVNMELFTALGGVGEQLMSDRSIRAVVLSGAGDNFCAGIDTNIFATAGRDLAAADLAPLSGSAANLFQRAAYVWREVAVPVACAIHGVAFGAGLQIALGADLRFAAPGSQLSIMEIKWGLIPDLAITTTARHIVPLDKLKQLAFTGRVISGAEALECGMVTALHDDPLGSAMQAAQDIAGKSPDAIRAMKKLINTAWDLPVSEALAIEARLQAGLIGSENQGEAVRANLEKKPPNFSN